MNRRDEGAPQGELTRALVLVVLLGIGVVVGLVLAYKALAVLKIIAVGILLAIVFRTIARGLERFGSPALAALVLLAGIGAFVTLLYLVVLPNVVHEIRVLTRGPNSLEALANSINRVPFAPELSEILERAERYLQRLLSSLPQMLIAAAGVITGVVAAVFLALYLALSPGTYVGGMLRLVPEGRREDARELLDDLGERLRGWVAGTAIVASFVGASAGVGLWLLGVPLPVTSGILAGFLNLVPLFGSIVGGVLPALLALTISPVKALEVVALFVVINQIEANFLQPKVMGGQVSVPPALILVSILVLGALLGPIIGTLLAIPAAVVVVTLVDRLTAKESPREEEREEGTKEENARLAGPARDR